VEKKLWVLMDEMTIVEDRFIARVIIGTLLPDHAGKIFL